MEDLCNEMDENSTYPSCIEEEFEIKDYDRKAQLRHIRELEEKRNLQEQKEIELERIQQQIYNKLKIIDKSDNTTKLQANPSIKQNEAKKDNRTDIRTLPSTVQKNHIKATAQSYKSGASFRSDRNVSNYHTHLKETSYCSDTYNKRHQQIPHRASRGRSFNYRSYHDRMKNQNRSSISDLQNDSDSNETRKVDQIEGKMKEYINIEFPNELMPADAQDEEEMLQEAIELSKQQMFIEKLEKREVDKAIEEAKILEENQNEGRKQQKQFDNRIIHKRSKDVSNTSFSNSNHDRCMVFFENQKGDNYNGQNNTNETFSGSSKMLYSNKDQRHGLSDDKKNVNITNNTIPHNRQESGNRHHHQSYKMHSETCKQIPNSQKQSRSYFTEGSSMEACSDKTDSDDINSFSWKESARKNLKQILHLDDSPDANVRTIAAETTDSLKINTVQYDTGGNNNRCNTCPQENNHFYQKEPLRGKFNTHLGTKFNYDIYHTESENNYRTHRGGTRRGLNTRYHSVQHNSIYNKSNSNNSENICVNWKPYAKFVEDGKTHCIPPRFRKQYEQNTS